MTIGVGLIISKYSSKECLDDIRERYGLDLIEISNSHIDMQLLK
ncbi:hypothetical protein [Clostridium cellulovorans]|uniref:Uncharacterized protein n=1 Tax=Clostridium cellulovorans (strain ATCC 35296 / DSM 3052 / OCM 3 / 743B) TaxID=573061 RepID=D9SRQ7_CLOC7|nr:hypothetical protein [Clostridium cellulovorans]ADL50424.1 hypothetical protein Clocel_0653 [Clostridium cellulovorans 743B]